MRTMATLLGAMSCCALLACGPSEAVNADSHLECAALISAATYLMRDGKVDKDPSLAKRALVSSMTHLNAYAIPNDIREREAFKEVNALRATLIGSVRPDEIMSRANRCVSLTPKSR